MLSQRKKADSFKNHLSFVQIALKIIRIKLVFTGIHLSMKGHKCRHLCLCIETGISYRSLTAAQKASGVDHSSISRCCKGLQSTAGGYKWRFMQGQDTNDEINL